MPNQTPPELEAKILEVTERYPAYSYIRISQQLKLVGIGASPAAVRGVWQRHGLVVRYQRLLWLERKSAELGGVLTEAQLRLLRKARGRLVDPPSNTSKRRIPGTCCARTPTLWAPSRGLEKSTSRR